MVRPDFPGGIYLIDFEFHFANRDGNRPVPVCAVVRSLGTGAVQRFWQDSLTSMPSAPYPTGPDSLTVAYAANAEMACFEVLGWPKPTHLIDLFVEFRCLTNGTQPPAGDGLLGALAYFGLPTVDAGQKELMRALILGGGPWSADERGAILGYCATDVDQLADLFIVMERQLDWRRAPLRGRYMAAAASIELRGIPIDIDALKAIEAGGDRLREALIQDVDSRFEVFVGDSFNAARFAEYLGRKVITDWPRSARGHLELADDVFEEMSRRYPELAELRELRATLAQMRGASLTVGVDGRNRFGLMPFRSKTGRNQPSTTRCIFGPAKWRRGLIKPEAGTGLAYIDCKQQEFGIAARLSNDDRMMEAYASGDPYLTFAKQAGAVPASATSDSHPIERERYKVCSLALQYGMGAHGMARRHGMSPAVAQSLIDAHKRTYARFWEWSDGIVDCAVLTGSLWTVFGWEIQIRPGANDRSIRNWPMQSNGAEMLRVASIELVDRGVGVCAPVHDAILIEAPLEELDATIERTQEVMREASSIVLDGFDLATDVEAVRYPSRYMHKRGAPMWNRVMTLLNRERDCVESARA